MVLTGIRIYPMQPVMQQPVISCTYGAGFRQGIIPFTRPPFHLGERPAAEGDEGLAGEVMHALAPVPFAPVPPCHYSSVTLEYAGPNISKNPDGVNGVIQPRI